MTTCKRSVQRAKYSLDPKGKFVIRNYNHGKPFSNFFPGIAGIWGIPMWVFYVNRGQCIASFGIESKDKSILEFQPANKSYRFTALQGFRTFLKIKTGTKEIFWEPFQNNSFDSFQKEQKMNITSHDLTIEDVHEDLGIKIAVQYFTLPEEPFAALVRRVVITNTRRKKYDIEFIDGLPTIVPFGIKDWLIKHLARTVEAWIKVKNVQNKVPFYQLNVEIADRPQVDPIQEGNFYFCFEKQQRGAKLFSPVVEAACVFGNSFGFITPEVFLHCSKFKVPAQQHTNNRMPSAMSHGSISLGSHQEKEIVSVVGHAPDQNQLSRIVKKITGKGFLRSKIDRNRQIVDGVKNFMMTKSACNELDLYNQQTFLDNVLRGGLPVSLKTAQGDVVFNVFSRKHGDLERDYNHFVLAPTFFSQGNGNYRDVNQNRRNDIWFNNDVKASIITNFLSLIQADGYNPLVIQGMKFSADDSQKVALVLDKTVKGKGKVEIREHIKKGFKPGDLLSYIIHNEIKLKVPLKVFLEEILGLCRKNEVAAHGEGFWSDHWSYNLDLLESFFSIYPDELGSLLLNRKDFTFYHNNHYVLPRDQRYILTDKGIRQYHSVFNGVKTIRAEKGAHKLRTQDGKGGVYQTTLLSKLLCVIANKVASLDPSGIGVEMEADKPNWYDALNGLPGLIGSSISETLELKRLCLFLLDALERLSLKDDAKVFLYSELHTFITRLKHVLSVETNVMAYWQQSNEVKEHYRYRIRHGIDGQENEITILELKKFLELVIKKTSKAPGLAKTGGGLYSTYFYHSVVSHERLDKYFKEDVPFVKPTKFKRHALPLFLEGFVHGMRVVKSTEEARRLYQRIKKSPLFDKKLKMYKVNVDLSKETKEIGRASIFPRGWLENESIWLHMEYKFVLELLKTGLYDEFYENFKNVIIPFLKPEIYGRSTLENSSFIVSSAHTDNALHGRGFVARLSGSTAEVVHIWLLMNMGKQPFSMDSKGKLVLTFRPVLAKWLFTKKKTAVEFQTRNGQYFKSDLPKNSYAFNLLGSTLVVYHNPKRKNTFGRSRCRAQNITVTYPGNRKPVEIEGPRIPAPYSEDVRNGKVQRIDVYFQ